MNQMRLIGVSTVVALISATCFASEQQLYFHLHQAYEYFEAFKKGECDSTSKNIQHHLRAADAELGKLISRNVNKRSVSIFEPELKRLWTLFNTRDRVSLAQIEEVRSEVQHRADALKLDHKKEWHDEIKACPF